MRIALLKRERISPEVRKELTEFVVKSLEDETKKSIDKNIEINAYLMQSGLSLLCTLHERFKVLNDELDSFQGDVARYCDSQENNIYFDWVQRIHFVILGLISNIDLTTLGKEKVESDAESEQEYDS